MADNEATPPALPEGLEFLLCSFVEMTGAPKAKLVPVTHCAEVAIEGAGFAGFAAGDMGQGPHSPDMSAIPDFDSLTVLILQNSQGGEFRKLSALKDRMRKFSRSLTEH